MIQLKHTKTQDQTQYTNTTILENRMRLVALGEIIDRQKAIIDYAREHGGPLSEAMK